MLGTDPLGSRVAAGDRGRRRRAEAAAERLRPAWDPPVAEALARVAQSVGVEPPVIGNVVPEPR